ncbi:MAG: flagellar filament capping protein FliD [Acidobacteriota bacterium]|nr:flagellar filament capping protein FliD [Acidobacteriota bacterium]
MSSPISSTSASGPITLSGFNNIDFNSILQAMMQQASIPLTNLQSQQQTLQSQNSIYSSLAGQLGTLETAAAALKSSTSLSGTSVTNTDPTAVSVSTGTTTPQGSYSIVVGALAQAQVTASSTTYADSDTTVVASGGSLTIGGATVTLTGNTTLQGLADAINGTANIPVTASVVQGTPGQYELVLTGTQTGTTNAFAITNNLTGGAGITFGANAQDAANASVTVNGLTITSATNTIANAIPGGSLTVSKADPATTISVTVNQDTTAAKSAIQSFVTAYNNLESFINSQQQASLNNTTNIMNDGVLRGLSSSLRAAIGGSSSADSTFQYLSQVGIGFDSSGNLTFDGGAFDTAVASSSLSHVQTMFSGNGTTDGIFTSIDNVLSDYVGSGGLVANQQTNITNELSSLATQISNMQSQLAIQQQSLQQQFTAADSAISALNQQGSSLSSLNSGYSLY